MLIEPAENFAYKKLSKTLGRSEDELPPFPVDGDIFPQVKQRVQVSFIAVQAPMRQSGGGGLSGVIRPFYHEYPIIVLRF